MTPTTLGDSYSCYQIKFDIAYTINNNYFHVTHSCPKQFQVFAALDNTSITSSDTATAIMAVRASFENSNEYAPATQPLPQILEQY